MFEKKKNILNIYWWDSYFLFLEILFVNYILFIVLNLFSFFGFWNVDFENFIFFLIVLMSFFFLFLFF